ncbi:MAG TPA: glutaredoxin family protein [Propionicimonas sp.]|nr:glutaredoxin family protein [Propionicimonas sp.]
MVVVLVRDGCHLCVEALATVAATCADLGVPWKAVDVDSDPVLRERWTDHVPVTFVAGVEHARWFVDPVALRGAVEAAR